MFCHVFETYGIEYHLHSHLSCWYGYTSQWVMKKGLQLKQRNNGIKMLQITSYLYLSVEDINSLAGNNYNCLSSQ